MPRTKEPRKPGEENALRAIRGIIQGDMQLRITHERIQAHLRIQLTIEAPTMRRKRIDIFGRGAKNLQATLVELTADPQKLSDALLRRLHAGVNSEQKREGREPDDSKCPTGR